MHNDGILHVKYKSYFSGDFNAYEKKLRGICQKRSLFNIGENEYVKSNNLDFNINVTKPKFRICVFCWNINYELRFANGFGNNIFL